MTRKYLLSSKPLKVIIDYLKNQNLSYHNDQSEETVKPLRANETTESNRPEARENVSDLVRIGFCFRSDWLSFWTNHRAK